jgi:hypothetical protein
MWPHRKKSIGVRSGDLVGQAVGLPCPIQIIVSSGEIFSDLMSKVSRSPQEV